MEMLEKSIGKFAEKLEPEERFEEVETYSRISRRYNPYDPIIHPGTREELVLIGADETSLNVYVCAGSASIKNLLDKVQDILEPLKHLDYGEDGRYTEETPLKIRCRYLYKGELVKDLPENAGEEDSCGEGTNAQNLCCEYADMLTSSYEFESVRAECQTSGNVAWQKILADLNDTKPKNVMLVADGFVSTAGGKAYSENGANNNAPMTGEAYFSANETNNEQPANEDTELKPYTAKGYVWLITSGDVVGQLPEIAVSKYAEKTIRDTLEDK